MKIVSVLKTGISNSAQTVNDTDAAIQGEKERANWNSSVQGDAGKHSL